MSAPVRGIRNKPKSSTSSTITLLAEKTPIPSYSPEPIRSASPISVRSIPTTRSALLDSRRNANMEDPDQQKASDSTLASTSHLFLANDVTLPDGSVVEGDDQSSSLSDIDDGPDQEEPDDDDDRVFGEALPPNDSEAETERLEESPQKSMKHKNVVLSSSFREHEQIPSSSVQQPFVGPPRNQGEGLIPSIVREDAVHNGISKVNSESDRGPTVVPLEEPCGSNMAMASPPEVAGKKRKRTSPRSQEIFNGSGTQGYTRNRNDPIKAEPNGNSYPNETASSVPDFEEIQNHVEVTASDVEKEQANEDKKAAKDDSLNPSLSRGKKGKTGKRKGKKLREHVLGDPVQTSAMIVDDGYAVEDAQAVATEIIDEEEETATVEADGEEIEAEVEAVARTEEEFVKKKIAMDSLGAIEKYFAAFRDKLYDERVAQLTNELVQLTQPSPNHPEYIAMIQCLDQRCDEKIQHEQVLLEYKLKALETKSVAERSQLHSQYFQTVRAVREKKLEEVGEQWYQIQRDRRGWEGSGNLSDFTYKFASRRSQQITQQTAYNLEVSILSGVAKYVGFPAAPSINGARPSEIDEDFQNMGIRAQVRGAIQNHHTIPLHAALSVAPLSRRKPSADEQFMEQNAWANPQHPAHQHLQHLPQQQGSRQSQIGSSLTTPIAQRCITDHSIPKGSASTIPDEHSALNSSAAGTPVNIAQLQNRQQPDHEFITESRLSLAQPKATISASGTPAPSKGEISPTETRERIHQRTIPEHSLAVQEPPSALQRSTTPVSSSVSATPLSRQTAASRPGIFGDHLGIASSSSPSSTVKPEGLTDNPRASPPISHLQHIQGSVITAGAGMGWFAER